MPPKKSNFFVGLFMDGTKPSWSRVFATLFVIVPIGCLLFLVIVSRKIPDLVGLTGFVVGGVGCTYGANKFSTPGIIKAENK